MGATSATYFVRLLPSQQLGVGDRLFSLMRGFLLKMQDDGNLVLYTLDDLWTINAGGTINVDTLGEKNYYDIIQAIPLNYTKAVWATGTNGSGATSCVMQQDGNLVLYTADGRAVWASGTNGHEDCKFVCQDDGNLVIYRRMGGPLWASNTNAGAR